MADSWEAVMSKKAYIGDGVYVDYDGWNLILTAEDGIKATNTIYLEPDVLRSLLDYVEQFKNGDDPKNDSYAETDKPMSGR
jgi:hypothetical protein